MTIYLTGAGAICNLGADIAEITAGLFTENPTSNRMSRTSEYSGARRLPVGEIGSIPQLQALPTCEDSRNSRVLLAALKQLEPQIAALRAGGIAGERIGVVIGTSTSGISDGERAMAHWLANGRLSEGYGYQKQEISAPARLVAACLQASGPAFCVSSACTSGGKTLAAAARLIRLGVCDAVVAGGVDTLCKMTVEGFSSLSVTSDEICLPFSANRNGINIGEAAALFLVTAWDGPVKLIGWGETSDAHHISAPHPEGRGAEAAMRKALQRAGCEPSQVDYINFHGTGTAHNDLMEARATARLFGAEVHCGSTKGLTGHTLAAAGALEALFCWLTLQRSDGVLPKHYWDGVIDPELPVLDNLAAERCNKRVDRALSNSFAFGGNNLALLMERVQ